MIKRMENFLLFVTIILLVITCIEMNSAKKAIEEADRVSLEVQKLLEKIEKDDSKNEKSNEYVVVNLILEESNAVITKSENQMETIKEQESEEMQENFWEQQEETKEKKEREWYLANEAQDVELLAEGMYAEEGCLLKYYNEEPEKVERVFKLAGSVIINRRNNKHLKCETIYDVLFCKGQYAIQTQNRIIEGQEIPEIVYAWAQQLLDNGPIGPNNLIYQAEFEQGVPYDELFNQKFGCDPKYPE